MFLGFDIGTSGVKALLLDLDGRIIASTSASLNVTRPHPGWSEQAPTDWWNAVNETALKLARDHAKAMADVQAIGLSGQMHGMVALDKDDNVLRPAILWNDTRNAAEATELDEEFSDYRLLGGNAVMPGFTAPKALWMARHEPDLFTKITTILLPKDYVRFRMSGEKVSDMSDSAGTLWLDVAARAWSPALLSPCGLSIEQMPELAEGSAPAGQLRPDIAQKWGIKNTVTIAGGGGDNAAAACGLGVTNPGDAFLSLGTSGVVFSVTDSFAPAPANGAHAFCHALPDTWHQMGVILAATDCLNWLSEISNTSVVTLMNSIENNSFSPSPMLFHPYLSGERTPHNDALARGGFFGISRTDDRTDMTRAVLEGVAFAMADTVNVLAAADKRPSQLLATGGGAKSNYWLSLIAAVTDCDIIIPEDGDFGAALGAARLGLLASKPYSATDVATILRKPDIIGTISPDAMIKDALGDRRHQWQQLYAAIKTIR
ncbi:xylulokinase [Candidatus Puniceispirillum marinum]|uniref:Xylulose kinase n=1 Tax=Puniceispirillum marinum (strain IMCC1322) TaxID=488538 RepID=D5BQ10_PUNMI|nr:xylulokinase [Candidatus Puniceispirillum marinum]ADE38508.1 xylulokinase protein [Candidatus Puniceispirillum marinum IMCC1322]